MIKMNLVDIVKKAVRKNKWDIAKYTAGASTIPLNKVYHECLHGIGAKLVGGTWDGMTFNFWNWKYYLAKPIEWITLGFIDIEKIPKPTGIYSPASAEILGGGLTQIVSAATPAFVYTTAGLLLLSSILPSRWSSSEGKFKQAIKKTVNVALGAWLIYQPLLYAKITAITAEKGNDFYNIANTIGLTKIFPGNLAGVAVYGGILAASLGASYLIHKGIGWTKERFGKDKKQKSDYALKNN